jgi:hypothetical protein
MRDGRSRDEQAVDEFCTASFRRLTNQVHARIRNRDEA